MSIKQMKDSQQIVDNAIEYAAEMAAQNTPEYQTLKNKALDVIRAATIAQRKAEAMPARQTVPMSMSAGGAKKRGK